MLHPLYSPVSTRVDTVKLCQNEIGGKNMKKIICALLACIVLASAVPASATNLETAPSDEIAPQYIGTMMGAAGILIDANGNATCSGDAYLKQGYTAIVGLSLHQRISGSWEPQITWYKRGSGTIFISQNYPVTSGFEYRTVLTINVYDSDGNYVESVYATSATASY